MGYVPRKFFCGVCCKERWPGDCAHGRVESDGTDTSMPWFDPIDAMNADRCGRCEERPRNCKCHGEAKTLRERAAREREEMRLRALVTCPCPHHLEAYRANDVDRTVRCGKCCGKVSTVVVSGAGPIAISGSHSHEIVYAGDSVSPVSLDEILELEIRKCFEEEEVTAPSQTVPVSVPRNAGPPIGVLFPTQPAFQSISANLWSAVAAAVANRKDRPFIPTDAPDWLWLGPVAVRLGRSNIHLGECNGLWSVDWTRATPLKCPELLKELSSPGSAAGWVAIESTAQCPAEGWGCLGLGGPEDFMAVQKVYSDLLKILGNPVVRRGELLISVDRHGPQAYVRGLNPERVKVTKVL